MGKSVLPIEFRFTQAQIDAGDANTLSGVRIVIVDANSQPTGKIYESGAAGVAPVESSGGIKNNLAATTAPTSSNDSTQGYSVGSRWIDTTNNESYICTKATNPASWSQTTVGIIGEVAGLQTALDGKSATTHNHDAAYTAIAHGTNVSNPHSVTKTQVGLGSADNTSDSAKPVSTAQQTALNLKANLASPTFTGTIQLDGSPILGDGANQGQRTYSDVAGAAMLMTNTTGTATSTIANTDIAARFVKPGTASVKSNASLDIVIGSHTAGINANTQVDFRLGNGATNTPDVTVLSLKGDGSVLAGANQLATTAVATTSANGLMASADKTKLDGVATGAEVNVQPDYTQATTTADDYIKNKPTIPALEGTTVPVMNGTAAVGAATTSSRSDHIHGSDTAKANTASLTDGSVSAYFDELRFDRVRAISNTDLNTLAVSGAYDGTNFTNAPGGSTAWFYIEHLMHSNAAADPGWRLQKAYGLGSPNSGFGAAGTMYIRTMVSNVWQAWRTVTTT